MSPAQGNDTILKQIQDKDSFPIGFEALEKRAREVIGTGPFGYIHSGAGKEETLKNNTASFGKYAIVPRFLNDVSNIDTRVELFGSTYSHPIGLAPVGMLRLAHEEAELAVSRAAAGLGIPYIQSTVSSYSMDDVCKVVPDSPKWFQLYWSTDQEISYSFVKRAEKAGYEAIVVTIDTVMLGWRQTDVKNQFSPLKLGYGTGNYASDEVFLSTLPDHSEESIIDGVVNNIYHPTLCWDNILELKRRTSLPVVLKGILDPEDAKQAIDAGIDGIIVSNHGGRQLDGAIAAIDALPGVVEAAAGRVPVLFDSGIRSGADVMKAVALGADMAFVGRPFVYGLAIGGQEGVEKVLSNIIQEFTVSTSLAGAQNISQLKARKVAKV